MPKNLENKTKIKFNMPEKIKNWWNMVSWLIAHDG